MSKIEVGFPPGNPAANVPAGGNAGDVLTKNSGADYDDSWQSPATTSPGGVDTNVQFNDSGAFGGDSGLVYDKTVKKLTVTSMYANPGPAGDSYANLGENLKSKASNKYGSGIACDAGGKVWFAGVMGSVWAGTIKDYFAILNRTDSVPRLLVSPAGQTTIGYGGIPPTFATDMLSVNGNIVSLFSNFIVRTSHLWLGWGRTLVQVQRDDTGEILGSFGGYSATSGGQADYLFISTFTGNTNPDSTFLHPCIKFLRGTATASGDVEIVTNLICDSVVITAPVTVATLPVASAALRGARSYVKDSLAPTFGAIVVGGGGVDSPVYCDGTNWRVG